MTERPILFSGEMVRAILDGRKTQTRRVVKPPKWAMARDIETEHGIACAFHPDCESLAFLPCPYAKIKFGNKYVPHYEGRLWVRETWARTTDYDGQFLLDGVKALYRADDNGSITPSRWRPSIHMPRALSRITLEVTGVRVERVQDISQEDAKAEGVEPFHPPTPGVGPTWIPRFEWLWDDINGKRGFGWNTNPWVWVISFKRLEETR